MTAERYIQDAEQYGKSEGSTSASGINWAAAFGNLCGSMKYMQASLDAYTGDGQTPAHGCRFTVRNLGPAKVLVEYEIVDGWVVLCNVLLNGVWCDAEDVIPDYALQQWRDEIDLEQREAA